MQNVTDKNLFNEIKTIVTECTAQISMMITAEKTILENKAR